MHTEPRCRIQNPSLESIPKQGRDFFRSFVTSVIVKSIFVRIESLLYEKMETACSMLNYFCWSMLNFVICKTSRLFVSIIFITETSPGTMVKRVPQEQMFIIEATLLENHFLPSSGFVMLMSVEDVFIKFNQFNLGLSQGVHNFSQASKT